jgi:hypothetical protein
MHLLFYSMQDQDADVEAEAEQEEEDEEPEIVAEVQGSLEAQNAYLLFQLSKRNVSFSVSL